MKKIFTTLMLLVSVLAFSQNGKFYASFEDFQKDKPIEGVEVVDNSWAINVGIESFKVKKGESIERFKVTNLPGELFTYNNYLIRVSGKYAYIILVAGKNAYYSLYNAQAKLYVSESMTGELKKYNQKKFEKLLKENGLFDDYVKDKPKREFKDSVNDYFNKTVSRNVKYFNLLNERMK